jgi:hypothetical protein
MTDVTGVWSLVAWRRSGGGAALPFGEAPVGALCYDASGFVSAQLMRSDAASYAPAGHVRFLAYCGRWRIEGAQVVHTVAMASLPEWVGTDLVREWSFTPQGRLVLLTPWRQDRHGRSRDEVEWQRGLPGI